MRSVRISWKTAQLILGSFPNDWVGQGTVGRAFAELRAAMAPRKSVKAAATRRTAKRASKKEETAAIRAAVMKRAGKYCEACLSFCPSPEMDHFFGRVRAAQSERSCWSLCRLCHREKTNNAPSAAHWLEAFVAHCERHGYREEAGMAVRRLGMVQAKATLSAGVAP